MRHDACIPRLVWYVIALGRIRVVLHFVIVAHGDNKTKAEMEVREMDRVDAMRLLSPILKCYVRITVPEKIIPYVLSSRRVTTLNEHLAQALFQFR